MNRSLAFGVGLLIWLSTADCRAQHTASPSTTLSESLSEEVNDPTATLTQAQIQDFFTPSEFGTNAQPNRLQGRFILAVLPHGPLPLAQIVRPTFSLVTIPQNKGASTRTEFGDLQLLDLFVMPRSMTEGVDFQVGHRTILCFSHRDLTLCGPRRMAGRSRRGIQVSPDSWVAHFGADAAGDFVRLHVPRANSNLQVNVSANAQLSAGTWLVREIERRDLDL
jgi:hypothetical protein